MQKSCQKSCKNESGNKNLPDHGQSAWPSKKTWPRKKRMASWARQRQQITEAADGLARGRLGAVVRCSPGQHYHSHLACGARTLTRPNSGRRSSSPGWRGGNGGAGRRHRRRRSLQPRARHGLVLEHALLASAGQRGRGRVQKNT